jgi:hypothetical protein
MKKLFTLALALLLGVPVMAQGGTDKLYVILELMRVDNEQEAAYAETENFWEKIHQERVKSGDIIGWDWWQILPGGEDQGYQYLTATLFNDAVKMFDGGDLLANAKKAYPGMTEQALLDKLNGASKTRDLAVRIYVDEIANASKEGFTMKPGMVAHLNMMKVPLSGYNVYETAETEVFQPVHQAAVNDGHREYWALGRFMVPYGSATYASHMTVDMFKDMKQALSGGGDLSWGELSEAQQKSVSDGIATRDQKFQYVLNLLKVVR